MKINILHSVLLFIAFAKIAPAQVQAKQVTTRQIDSVFAIYTNFLKEGKYNEALELTDPNIFKVVSKETLAQAMEQSLNDPSFKIQLGNGRIVSHGWNEQDGENIYHFFTYEIDMTLKPIDEELLTEEKKSENRNILLAIYEATFDKGNVVYDKTADIYNIKSKKDCLAIITENKFYFHSLGDQSKLLSEQILPTNIYNKAYGN